MTEAELDVIEAALLQHEECIQPGSPRSISIHPLIPVWAVMEVLRNAR